MIVVAFIIGGVATVAFAAVVIGVQITDHRMRLRDTSQSGFTEAFARNVLGVYTRQAPRPARDEDAPGQIQARR